MAPKPQEGTSSEQESFGTTLSDENIVISGVAGLYPSSHHVKDLSNILYNKINPVTNDTRWKYNHPEVAQYTGNVPGLQYFDAQFFKVHFRLSNNMDSMARKILEQSYAAIYDAGLSPEHLSGKKVGVYIGTCFSESEKACFYVSDTRTGFGIAGCSKTMFANRISYWLNAKGPSMSIDEACSSSTAALESAYLAMLRGECESAIVGGANICLHPQSSIHYGRIMKLSMDGKTRSFDSNAAGCVRSEAINVVFLQKAKDARRIYAEIVHVKNEFNSIMVTEKGPKYGFYRDPSKITSFLKTFYEEAKVPPKVVQYVEAFGSAVPEADKAELEAIDEVFSPGRNNSLMVGSVMSNIGYGEAASGISAITKVLLGYHHGKIAANLNCNSPRQDVAALREGRLEIVSEHKKFDRTYTAVNSLSITGINAHVLLNGHYKPKDLSRYKSNIPHLVLVSARQDSGVSAIFEDLKTRVVDPEELALFNNIHETKISGHLGRGFMILDSSDDEGTICLREVVHYFDEAKRPLWFVYSGMGSQWAGMGSQLMRIPVFAAAIEKCRKVLEPKGIDIVHIITSPDKTMFNNILHSFVGIAAIQIGLTDILRALNIFPDKIIGHSVGELGCAYADGCFTAEEMILSAYCRGLVSVQTPFIRGSMAAVGLGYEEISKLCPPEVEVACHNGPDSSTISGPADIMKEFVATLTDKGIFAKEVPCSNIAYHSRYIAEAGPGLLKYLSEVITSPKPRSERWVSTSIPQDRWDEPIAKYSSAEYHTNNLLNSVLFEETSKLIPANAVVVEIAPHGLLQAILKRSLPESCRNIPLTRRGHPDNAQFLLEAVGRLYMEGCMPKVSALYPEIKFPVSTGTPMLSHLVQWAHHENWYLPLYATANRKFAACCNYVLSVHDDEHEYLSGHVLRGKNVYPYAATLVAVWDTLAMSLGKELKQLPVQFQNVHLQSQPILHDKRQLRINITLHRGTGRFEVMDGTVIIAKGFIMENDTKKLRKLDTDAVEEESINLNTKEIYQLLHARDYGYKNAFRSIFSANATLSSAEIIWKNNWVTLIDGMLQLNILKTTHDTVSQPNFIRKISIDVEKHLDEAYEVDGSTVIKARMFDKLDSTRCGGVVIDNVQFLDMPPLNEEIALQSLKFIPFFSIDNNIDEYKALSVFIQITAENLNKKKINIVELLDNETCLPQFEYINKILYILPGFDGSYSKMYTKNIVEGHDNCLANVDVLLITNLEKDENIYQKLNQVLQQDTFIINKEHINKTSVPRPSLLHRTISAHNIGAMKLELAIWQPLSIAASSVLTVRSTTDLNYLSSTLTALTSRQRIIVLSSNPPVPGLKSLIKQYRTELKRKVNLIMVNHKMSAEKQYLDHMHDCDLAFTVVDHGIWGGEYYLPIEGKSHLETEVVLKTGRIADLDSLHWEEIAEPIGSGVTVKVHYAGINIVDVNRQIGINKLFNDYNQTSTAIDFSGTTLSGTRVMGVTQTEGISSSLKANLNLLWPIPTHWSFEDAATVPLAYCMAFYMLCIKSQLCPNFSILVHGGAGALGQAIISIALSQNCTVFTTVSNENKKRFLLKLFPKLKADHIGNSRDISFSDLVHSATKGQKCDVVIICSRSEDKTASLNCCGSRGVIFDTAQIHNREDYNFGMHSLTLERSYVTVNFSSIFMPEYAEDMKQLQVLVSEGIARGYVRPLSRVTFAPQDVPRAFRFVATSRHRGRVLLDLRQAKLAVQSRLFCSPELCQLVWSDNEILGIKLVDRLISQGAKKIILHLHSYTNSLQLKLRLWKNIGVQIKISTENSCDIKSLMKYQETFGQIDSVFIIVSDHKISESEMFLESVSIIASNVSSKFFAIIRPGMIDEQTLVPAAKQRGVMNVYLPPIKHMDKEDHTKDNAAISINSTLDALAKARSYKESVVFAHTVSKPHESLLKQLSIIADINIPNDVPTETSLKELNMDASKVPAIHAYLRNIHNIYISEETVSTLSIKSIIDLEKYETDETFEDHKGLHTLFSSVDPDELLATTEMIFVPTLTNNSSMRDDEFDVNETYLCVVPGVEGLHSRFRNMCERLKLAALVLQPGLDNPHETVQEIAQRYAKTLLVKTELKNKFYLLGYETGIMVALEIAAILEDHGLTGTVFCVGGSPDEVLAVFEEKLQDFNSDVALQKAVIKHMITLMINDSTIQLDDALNNSTTWRERVNACVKSIYGRITHSQQYAIGLIEAAYARIVQARKYNAKPRALRSLLISLRPKYYPDTDSHKLSLNDYSKQPIITYQLDAPLAYATEDLRCAAIINRHLDNDILNAFSKKNLCDSYLINAEAFMVTHANTANQ